MTAQMAANSHPETSADESVGNHFGLNFIPHLSQLWRCCLTSAKSAFKTVFSTFTWPPIIQHPFGYQYLPILCHWCLEILLLKWSAGNESKPHSHKISFNLTRVTAGTLLERKYHISEGHLIISSERLLQKGQWAWTLPFEIHELIALGEPAQTLHFYFPGRS